MSEERYPGGLRALHWLVSLLVFCAWPLGMVIKFVRDDVKLDFYLLHESIGFLVLWLMLVRLGMRLTSPMPKPVDAGVLHLLAGGTHALLYAALVVVPLSGFLATNAHGFPLNWFGIVPVWSPIGKAPDIAPLFSRIHTVGIWILLCLFALHFAGVLFHHVIRRDRTLHRIL